LPSIFLSIILLTLIYQLIVSDITQIRQKKLTTYKYYQQQNQKLLQENKEFQISLQAIGDNIDIIESIARYEFGLIKNGEKYYTYSNNNND
jgi:cell division protein FtsB